MAARSSHHRYCPGAVSGATVAHLASFPKLNANPIIEIDLKREQSPMSILRRRRGLPALQKSARSSQHTLAAIRRNSNKIYGRHVGTRTPDLYRVKRDTKHNHAFALGDFAKPADYCGVVAQLKRFGGGTVTNGAEALVISFLGSVVEGNQGGAKPDQAVNRRSK